jgi:hypothetical protein
MDIAVQSKGTDYKVIYISQAGSVNIVMHGMMRSNDTANYSVIATVYFPTVFPNDGKCTVSP